MARYHGIRSHAGGIEIRYQVRGRRLSQFIAVAPTDAALQDAAKLRRRLIEAAKLGEPAAPAARIDFEGACREYLKHLRLAKALKPATVRTYERRLVAHWSELARLDLREITLARVKAADARQEWRTQKTRRDCLSALSCVFRWAMDAGYCEANPARLVKVGKHQKPQIDPFGDDEIAAIFAELRGVPRAFYRLMLETGCRTGELCALKWSEVEAVAVRIVSTMSDGEIVGTKTHHARRVLLTREGQRIVREHQSIERFRRGFVFLTQHGNPYQVDDCLTAAFRAACARAGVRYRRPYNLRHTYASRALSAGVEPSWLAVQMGDHVETVLRHYARWIGGERDARELEKLERRGEEVGNPGAKVADSRGKDGAPGEIRTLFA